MIATTSKVDIVRWDINKKKKKVESFTLYYDFIKTVHICKKNQLIT